MRVVNLSLNAEIESASEMAKLLLQPGDAVLIKRGVPRLLGICCPCGCGENYVINLDSRSGPAWRLYVNNNNATVFPSVWRDVGCESHYIISKGKIYLFDKRSWEDGGDSWSDEAVISETDVLNSISDQYFESVESIADYLVGSPWDILLICRKLTRKGLVLEGDGLYKGMYKRI